MPPGIAPLPGGRDEVTYHHKLSLGAAAAENKSARRARMKDGWVVHPESVRRACRGINQVKDMVIDESRPKPRPAKAPAMPPKTTAMPPAKWPIDHYSL